MMEDATNEPLVGASVWAQDLYWEFLPGDPAIPRLDLHLVDGEVVRDLTEQRVAREKADLRELKKLKKDLRDFKDTTLWSLLVDLMLRDTEKHIALLGFVEEHA